MQLSAGSDGKNQTTWGDGSDAVLKPCHHDRLRHFSNEQEIAQASGNLTPGKTSGELRRRQTFSKVKNAAIG